MQVPIAVAALAAVSFLSGMPVRAESEPARQAPDEAHAEHPVVAPTPRVRFPVMRWAVDLRRLADLLADARAVAGQDDWLEDRNLLNLLEDIPVDAIVAAQGDRSTAVVYDIHATLPVDGGDEWGMTILALLPRAAFEVEDLLGIDPDAFETDSEGFAMFPDEAETAVLIGEDDVAVLADESLFPNGELTDEARTLLRQFRDAVHRDLPQEAMSVSVSPAEIRPGLRQPFTDMILATLNAGVQERDNEPPLSYRSRALWGKSIAELIDVIANQTNTIRLTLRRRAAAPGVELQLVVEAVPNSNFDAWLTRQRDGRNTVLRNLHPKAAGHLSCCLALPDVLQDTLPPLSIAATDWLADAGLLSRDGAAEFNGAVRNLVDRGRLEVLLQLHPGAGWIPTAVVCLPLFDSPNVSNATIELVSAVNDGSIRIAERDIDGWPVHVTESAVYGVPLEGSQLELVATDSLLAVQFRTVDSPDLLPAIVRHDFEDAPDLDRRRRLAVSAELEVWDVLRSAFDEGSRIACFGDRDASAIAADDTVRVSVYAEGHALHCVAAFDRTLTVVALSTYDTILTAAFEGLDF